MLIRSPYDLRHMFRAPAVIPPPSALQITFGPQVDQITTSSATVTWGLNTFATGVVHYGPTTAYGSTTTPETSLSYSTHAQGISGLASGTLYHYKVVGQDALNDTYDSGDLTFTTTGVIVVPPPGGSYPTPAPLVYSAMVAMTAPGYLAKTTDSNYGTEVTRVGQNDMDRNLYASIAAWNCDGSLFALHWGSGHQKLFDTTTSPWTLLNGNCTFWSADMSWSDTDPLSFYRAVNDNAIGRYTIDPVTGTATLAQSWSLGATRGYTLIGGWQGQMGGGYVPYTAASHSVYGCLDLATGTKWEVNTGVNNRIDAVFVTWDGSQFVILFNGDGTGTTQGTWAMSSANPAINKRQLSTTQDHGDVSQLANGDNVWVMCNLNPATGQGWGTGVGMWNLDSADAYTPIMTTNYVNAHLSGRNIKRPGYFYMSNGLYSTPSNMVGHQDLFAINLDDPPANGGDVEYYAKQRSPDPSGGYGVDPMATVHPFGIMVAWSTRMTGTSSVYCYVAGVDTGM